MYNVAHNTGGGGGGGGVEMTVGGGEIVDEVIGNTGSNGGYTYYAHGCT